MGGSFFFRSVSPIVLTAFFPKPKPIPTNGPPTNDPPIVRIEVARSVVFSLVIYLKIYCKIGYNQSAILIF